MSVLSAPRGSVKALLHDAVADPAAVLVFPPDLPEWLREGDDPVASGCVVHHPAAECGSNDVGSVMGRRYDALLLVRPHARAVTAAWAPLLRDAR